MSDENTELLRQILQVHKELLDAQIVANQRGLLLAAGVLLIGLSLLLKGLIPFY